MLHRHTLRLHILFHLFIFLLLAQANTIFGQALSEQVLLQYGWRFYRYGSIAESDSLIYDVRPSVGSERENGPSDAESTKAVRIATNRMVLKPWILPTANDFIKDPEKHYVRPAGDPGMDFPFVQADYDDHAWETVTVPHDWGIRGPFYEGDHPGVDSGMGSLPVAGVAWYRIKFDIDKAEAGKSIMLSVEGAMSYAMVWCNGHLVGGWPYGYASWQLDLTPYVIPGGVNQLAIRIDNPPLSSRWYPGAGLYRNVWLIKKAPVHVGTWGTFVSTRDVSEAQATVDVAVTIENDLSYPVKVTAVTDLYRLDHGAMTDTAVAQIAFPERTLGPKESRQITGSVIVPHPHLWGPPPNQEPHCYSAVTTVYQDGKPVDVENTTFGIRTLTWDAQQGLLVNGEHIFIKGVNQHHDLGALGAAFNVRAAERQLLLLREMGCNAIRLAHNPPAPELLALTDRMGFLVIDEIFDVWEQKKTPLDFHLIFSDWSEPDIRAFVRRDRNHPSVMLWSFGNEVGEQYTGEAGAAVARRLYNIVKEEDPTRMATASMNYAKPDMPFSKVMDVITLNYQGEGVRDAPAYAGLPGISTPPLYDAFHKAFPDKVILSSENAAAISTRGTFLFPVADGMSAPAQDGAGADDSLQYVSAYELYTVPFGASADKVFASVDAHPYVAGGFVWCGWDYLGEPAPYYSSRSAYFGVIDLAGFKKERFYLYQARWCNDRSYTHVLPHWTWPGREGMITPVHVFTNEDDVEVFLNNRSLGRKQRAPHSYRLRWDSVRYAPGELKVVTYHRDGQARTADIVHTAGPPARLEVTADCNQILTDHEMFLFVSLQVTDAEGHACPTADPVVHFTVAGPGELVATDNGDPRCHIAFPSPERPAFQGKCLAIVQVIPGQIGVIRIEATAQGVMAASVRVEVVGELPVEGR